MQVALYNIIEAVINRRMPWQAAAIPFDFVRKSCDTCHILLLNLKIRAGKILCAVFYEQGEIHVGRGLVVRSMT